MYILNPILHSEINAAVLRVKRQLPQLEFDEFIAIPAFGSNIILRFDYTGNDKITLDALDLSKPSCARSSAMISWQI